MCESQGYMEPQASGGDKAEDAVASKPKPASGEFERLAMRITAELLAPLQFNPDFRAPEAIRYVEKLTSAHNADMQAALARIAELEARLAEARRVVRPIIREWINSLTHNIHRHYECKCGKDVDVLNRYCPSCGAKLDWTEAQP